ncbi:hypothetical protein Droror1_Dr00023155 [Drosera rotundifolia]
MPSVITKEMRDKAIVHYGHDKCQEGLRYLLDEVVGLPNAIIPLENAEECGYIPETGFVWIKQQKKRQVLNPRTGQATFPAKWWTEDEDMKNSIQQGRGTKTLLQRTKGLLKV